MHIHAVGLKLLERVPDHAAPGAVVFDAMGALGIDGPRPGAAARAPLKVACGGRDEVEDSVGLILGHPWFGELFSMPIHCFQSTGGGRADKLQGVY
jgi:hypothetical protein